MNYQESYYKIHLLVWVCGVRRGVVFLSLLGQPQEDIARAGAGMGERSPLHSGEVENETSSVIVVSSPTCTPTLPNSLASDL